MSASVQARQENVVVLADVRAERRAASLPVSLEMDWEKFHSEDEPMSMAKTIWFAVVISTALWAVIAGAVWFV